VDRILRGTGHDGFYSTTKLGAYSVDLGAVACFFEEHWKRLAPGLSEPAQAWLLNEAARRLSNLGRVTESLEPMRAGLPIEIRREDWNNAAIRASNLSEAELTLGDLAAAVRDAEQSVAFDDASGDGLWRRGSRTTLAHARHQSGWRADALALFRAAESMQVQRQPQYPLLYSLPSFQYCDLLLGDVERMAWITFMASNPAATDKSELQPQLDTLREVEQRAAQTLEWATTQDWSLDITLDRLTLGRVALYRAILEDSSFGLAHDALTAAVDGFRAAGVISYLPRGLLTRAWLRFLDGDADGAKADLDDAWQIAKRGAMKLHMADIHLHRARLFRNRAALEAAAKLIDETGYHRRDDELRDAQEAAQHWPEQPDYPRTIEADSSDTSDVETLDAERGNKQDSGAAAEEKPMLQPNVPRPVFISYAREDNRDPDPKKRWLDRLRTHLKPLEFDGQLTICSDQEIAIGDDWREHIQTHLDGARAAVLLISSNFMASEFIRNSELPVLLRRAKEQGTRILPVLVGPSRFDKANFKYPDPNTGPEEFTLASLQAAGSPDKTLIEMNEGEQERVLLAVANRIEQIVQGALQNLSRPVAANRAERGGPGFSGAR